MRAKTKNRSLKKRPSLFSSHAFFLSPSARLLRDEMLRGPVGRLFLDRLPTQPGLGFS